MSGQGVSVASPADDIELTEDLLERFDRAARSSRLDDMLFVRDTRTDLAATLDTLLAAIKSVDLGALLAKQAWRHRLLGADVEARVRFSLAHRQSCDALVGADAAARATALKVEGLRTALVKVEEDQKRLARVAARAEVIKAKLLPPASRSQAELQARFERRYANLSSVRAANALTLVQLPIDISRYRGLLDRFADVKGMLFPVWERHALSLAQSPNAPDTASQMRVAAQALIDRLMDGREVASHG